MMKDENLVEDFCSGSVFRSGMCVGGRVVGGEGGG